MALFVLGAGATRGCSFVDASSSPCLPPLDADFFTQLQRVRNSKHDKLVSAVMADVVDLFGSNFDASMETVFATLGHTLRMLETTGENRDFRRSELRERRARLEQAIAVVLEDSLTETSTSGGSSQTARPCDYHERLVADLMEPKDDVIGFNYDCVLD